MEADWSTAELPLTVDIMAKTMVRKPNLLIIDDMVLTPVTAVVDGGIATEYHEFPLDTYCKIAVFARQELLGIDRDQIGDSACELAYAVRTEVARVGNG